MLQGLGNRPHPRYSSIVPKGEPQMTETMDWLEFYNRVAEDIDDDILDEADELFGLDDLEEVDSDDIPDEYYIYCASTYYSRHPSVDVV